MTQFFATTISLLMAASAVAVPVNVPEAPVQDDPVVCCEEHIELPELTGTFTVSYRGWDEPEHHFDLNYERRYTEEEVIIVAKILYRECRGIPSLTEKACVVWTMCNRVDAGYADTIKEVATAKDQYAWYPDTPVWDELYDLALDVLDRWSRSSAGWGDCGRVLPADYLWFSGDGKHNNFRNQYRGGTCWDYSLETPYES